MGWPARDGVRTPPWGTPQGPGHLEHDVQRPVVQRVRPRRADAEDGPGPARGDPTVRSRRRNRGPSVHGVAYRTPLRAPLVPDARAGVAGPDHPLTRAPTWPSTS